MAAGLERGVIGCAIRPFRGRVEAAFARAAHVRAGDLVITLSDLWARPHPYAIAWSRFAEVAAAPGEAVELSAEGLTVGRVRALLGPMRTYTPREGAPRWVGHAVLARAVAQARATVAGLRWRGGLHAWLAPDLGAADRWSRAILEGARPGIAAAADATRARSWGKLAEAATQLAGLGPGLTPSGDDFLAGLLAAIRYHGTTAGHPVPQAALDEVAWRGSAGTTTYAGFQIRCAARGLVSEPVERWLMAVHAGSNAITVRTAAVAAMGHSSGVDLLAGLVCGLEKARGWRA